MIDFEKLGLFYLGRESDAAGTRLGNTLLYDSRDLLTHAVCVGMTGSGKTGLCLSVVEEAAIDGVPVIAIDPKGDLSNLLLTFPRLAPEDFRPWIDEDEARRAGVTPDAFAAQQADLWRKGLAEWGEDGARIERLRAAAEFAIYTPGSRAGLPLSILSSFAAPPGAIREDAEALAERASSTATGVLTLAGANAEARGREHTFLSALFAAAWREGRDLDLGSLIQQVQAPPFQKIGVLDLDSFYPAKERFDLGMQLNAVLASPGFEQWLEGEPLDGGALLYAAQGGPRVSILSIAHLSDAQRMFFVSLLLNQIVGWMRAQSGTTSLRAIVYMDEIAGYFPPVANPPSKPPLLTLLKQARAFGVGVLLATQNTVDLDYKGLANAGTWFLGRLQTERDKARVLEGLEGVSAGAIDRAEVDKTLSSLGKRVFLLHNVHEKAPRTFQTRWTLSYLRGPLSRDQIRTLTDAQTHRQPAAPKSRSDEGGRSEARRAGFQTANSTATSAQSRAPETEIQTAAGPRPVLAPEIQQFFLPSSHTPSRYIPVALGVARVAISDAKLQIDETRDIVAITPIGEGAVPVDWSAAEILDIAPADLGTRPIDAASFEPVPKAAAAPKNYAAWQKAFAAWLAEGQRIELQRHPVLKITSHAGESERDFRIRVQSAQREARDAEVEEVRRRYADKRARLEEKVRKAEQGVAREQEQASQQNLQTAVSFGATVLGAFLGRKTVSAGTLGRATTAARGLGRSAKEQQDVKRAQDNVQAARKALEDLDAEIEDETKGIAARFDRDAGRLDRVTLTPRRGQIAVQFVALGWKPQ
jgi:hypothetical protein